MEMLWEVKRYLQRTGMPPTRFGRLVVNDPRLVGDMERGRQPGKRVKQRVRAFIAAHPERWQ